MKKFSISIVTIVVIILSATLLIGCDPGFVGLDGDRLSSDSSNSTNPPAGSTAPGDSYNVSINYMNSTYPEGGLPDIVDTAKHYAVSLFCDVVDSNGQTSTSSGSAVFFGTSEENNASFLLTCCHVIDQALSIKAALVDGEKIDCEFIGGDDEKDIAVLKVEGIYPCANIRNLEEQPLRLAESVFAIGNPLGTLGGSVTQGIISGVERTINMDGVSMTLLQIDVAVNPGNSGGPLFDFSGALVGIVNAKSVGAEVEGIGYSIKIDEAIQDATSILETAGNPIYKNFGYIAGKVRLGVTVQGAEENKRYYYTINSLSKYGSVAIHNKNQTEDSKKVFTKDVITAAKKNGESVIYFTDINTLGNLVKSLTVGDKLTLLINHPIGGSVFIGPTYEAREIEIDMKQYVYALS